MHEFSKPLTAGAAAAAIAVGGGMVNAQTQTPSGAVAIGDSGYYIGAQIESVALILKAPQSIRIEAGQNSSTLTVHSEDLTMQGLSLFVGQSFATSENLFVGYEAGFMLPGEPFDSEISFTERCSFPSLSPQRPVSIYYQGIVESGELAQAWWGRVRGGFTRKTSSFYGFAGLGSYEIDHEGASARTGCGATVSAPATTISDTSFEVGIGGNLLIDERILLRAELTFFEFDVYDGARVGLGAGMRF